MELVHKEQLQYAFPEFAPYLGHCQFPDCAHRKEPGCAVRKALAEGKIGQTRYSSYERLYELASQLKEWELKWKNPAPGRTTSRPGAGLFYDQERNELA